MSQVSIAEAKNTLTRLIHEAERGEAIHIGLAAVASVGTGGAPGDGA